MGTHQWFTWCMWCHVAILPGNKVMVVHEFTLQMFCQLAYFSFQTLPAIIAISFLEHFAYFMYKLSIGTVDFVNFHWQLKYHILCAHCIPLWCHFWKWAVLRYSRVQIVRTSIIHLTPRWLAHTSVHPPVPDNHRNEFGTSANGKIFCFKDAVWFQRWYVHCS